MAEMCKIYYDRFQTYRKRGILDIPEPYGSSQPVAGVDLASFLLMAKTLKKYEEL
jgi:hypothetical protein